MKWLVDELGVSPKEDSRCLHLVSLSQNPSEELFVFLAERGGDPLAEDEKLGTPLTLALQQGHDDFAKWLVEKYNLRCDQQGGSLEKTSPLHKACGFCSPKTVEFLMERGAQKLLEVVDAQDHTPLMVAVKEKKTENAILLLQKYKADPNKMVGTSALFIAAQDGYLPTTRALLENGADPNIWHKEMEIFPLHIAASNDHVFVVEELLKHKANPDCFSGKAYTPLTMACSQGYTETPRILLDHGANVNLQSPVDGATALHHACIGGFLNCAKMLVSRGADISIKDGGQMDPLQAVNAVLEEKPTSKSLITLKNFLSTLRTDDRGKCANCYKPLDAPKRCGKCKSVFYCSGECQKDHWKVHKEACK